MGSRFLETDSPKRVTTMTHVAKFDRGQRIRGARSGQMPHTAVLLVEQTGRAGKVIFLFLTRTEEVVVGAWADRLTEGQEDGG